MANEQAVGQHVDLVERARLGSDVAWEELFDAYFPPLYRYFRARVHSRETAEDLAAEVFAEAYRSLAGFHWRSRPFVAWLFGIGHNRLRMHYRRERRSMGNGSGGSTAGEFLSVEIRDVLERLPNDYRTAIEYRYVLGLSGEEAAALMERTHGAFRALLLRATRAFKQEYGSLDGPR